MRSRRFVVVCALLAAAAASAGCGGDEDKPAAKPATYTGAVEGSRAYIALVSDGKQVSGYLCDGKKVSRWLKDTSVSGDRADLVTRKGEKLGTATIGDSAASGTVTLAGRAHRFRGKAATGDAGLYRATGGAKGADGYAEAGWIVLADRTQRGSLNILDGTSNTLRPAPTLTFADGSVRFTSNVTSLQTRTADKVSFQDLR